MRIATWNIARCQSSSSRRASLLHEAIRQINADVWILTETYRDFTPSPDHRLVASSADAPDRDSLVGECWVAIWSRQPAETLTLSADSERTAAIVVDEMTIVGTVLPWLSDGRRNDIRGKDAFLSALAEQSKDWRGLCERQRQILCVAGDFNQDLLVNGHYYGTNEGRHALRTTLAEIGLQCLTGGTHDPLASTGNLACVDHLCVRGLSDDRLPHSFVWPEPGTLDKSLTDHYCVWVDLK